MNGTAQALHPAGDPRNENKEKPQTATSDGDATHRSRKKLHVEEPRIRGKPIPKIAYKPKQNYQSNMQSACKCQSERQQHDR